MGSHPVAVVQYTFTHKQHTERHKTNNTKNWEQHKNFGRVRAAPRLGECPDLASAPTWRVSQLGECPALASAPTSHHLYPSFYLPVNTVFQKAVSAQRVTDPVSLTTCYGVQNVPFLLDSLIFLHFSLDRSNWSSSFSSIVFQNFPGISWSTFRRAQISAPHKTMLHMYHFTSLLS
jgi:hypothetical protein